ncbi:MAG: hypothetical protein ACRENA_16185 [Vulcanimicrobiaceae bacterium]
MTSPVSLRLLGGCALSVLLATGAGAAERVASIAPGPQILAMGISDVNLHIGEKVDGHVDTTPDVTDVEIHIGYWHMPLPQTGTGRFAGSGKIPFYALLFRGNYMMRVVARTPNGRETERDVRISLR